MLSQISEKFDFESCKSYPEEDINDAISSLMPKILFYSTDKALKKAESTTDILEVALNAT
jgi:hypothetical protein